MRYREIENTLPRDILRGSTGRNIVFEKIYVVRREEREKRKKTK